VDNQNQGSGALARSSQGGLSRAGGGVGRYSPIQEMQDQMRRMDALFNRIFGYDPLFQFTPSWRDEMSQAEPEADIYESDTEIIVHAALPGVEPQDIHLEATEDSILLTAQRRVPFQSGGSAATQGDANSRPGMPSDTHDGTQPSGQTGAQPNSAVAEGAASEKPAPPPHTQHRQSRYSSRSTYRLVYTLPTPIDPNRVQANLRNGVLELRLPKQQPVSARPIPINVQSDNRPGVSGSNQTGQNALGGSRSQEGNPAGKMGSTYTPSAGEDHTAQAQSIGARSEHEPGRAGAAAASGQNSPVAAGQTNPMAPATSEAKRS
jgi:HSP20 family protein